MMRALPLALAASLGLAACGSSGPTILNTEKVERAIESSALDQRGKLPRVSCPSGVHQKAGNTFSCTALVGATATRFTVTQADGSGEVHFEAR